MVRLHVLGRMDLTGSDGSEQRFMLSQPKPLAVLVYLAVAKPLGFHRSDELLRMFWPEITTVRERQALSQTLHVLRESLGSDAIDSRGSEEIRLRERVVWCDAIEFDRALAAGESDDATSLYAGDFLSGFFLPDAPEFERWMSRERSALRNRAAAAAWLQSVREQERGNRAAASAWALRAVDLAPYDESALRRLMELLDRLGDRSGAVRAFNQFASRLERDLSLAPSAETIAVFTALRVQGDGPFAPKSPGKAASLTGPDYPR